MKCNKLYETQIYLFELSNFKCQLVYTIEYAIKKFCEQTIYISWKMPEKITHLINIICQDISIMHLHL